MIAKVATGIVAFLGNLQRGCVNCSFCQNRSFESFWRFVRLGQDVQLVVQKSALGLAEVFGELAEDTLRPCGNIRIACLLGALTARTGLLALSGGPTLFGRGTSRRA